MEASRSWSDRRTELGLTGMGGSDAAGVCGISSFAESSPYRKTPFTVWLSCTGRAEDGPQSQNAEWGTRLESGVLRKYAESLEPPFILIGRDSEGRISLYERHGTDIRISHNDPLLDQWGHLFETLRHPDYDHLFCHIDGVVVNSETGKLRNLVEAKTTSDRRGQTDQWGDDGSDDVPDEYIIQVHHNAGIMAANGYTVPFADIPTLILSPNYQLYTVPIDPQGSADVFAQLDTFWRTHVETGIAPPVVGADNKRLTVLYPEDDGESISAPNDLFDVAIRLGRERGRVAEAKGLQAEAEAQIKAAMGDASEIVGDDWRCTWKQSKASAKTDWKAVVDDIREAVDLDVRVTAEVLDGITRDRTEVKPGTRRFLPYGIAKGAK